MAMQRLDLQLIIRLAGHKHHCGSANRLANGLRVYFIVLIATGDVRMRFFFFFRQFGHGFSARLTQIDYDREMALVALEPGAKEVLGVVRLISDPDGAAAEFAVMVRSDSQGVGLGYCLMQSILDYARQRGIGRVFGDVLLENRAMLQMAEKLGFRIGRPDGESSVTVEITLDASDGTRGSS